MQHDWFVDSVGHEPFWGFRDVFTNLIVSTIFLFIVMVLQPLDSLCILHSSERLLWRNKCRVEFVNQVAKGGLEGPVYHITDKIFETVKKLVEVNEWTLSLYMAILGHV